MPLACPGDRNASRYERQPQNPFFPRRRSRRGKGEKCNLVAFVAANVRLHRAGRWHLACQSVNSQSERSTPRFHLVLVVRTFSVQTIYRHDRRLSITKRHRTVLPQVAVFSSRRPSLRSRRVNTLCSRFSVPTSVPVHDSDDHPHALSTCGRVRPSSVDCSIGEHVR
jgi:hypothetical protein